MRGLTLIVALAAVAPVATERRTWSEVRAIYR